MIFRAQNLRPAVFILFSLVPFFAHARWKNADEADCVIEDEKTKIEIPADARVTTVSTFKIKVLTETCRQSWGTLRYNYNPASFEYKITHASVTNNGLTSVLDDDKIVDLPIRGQEFGFDNTRQVMIAFPQVQIGSELAYELRSQVLKPVVPDEYSQRLYFNNNTLTKEGEVDVHSAKRLYLSVNDPDHVLDIQKSEDKNIYHYVVKFKNYQKEVVEEPQPLLSEKKLAWVAFSTSPDYPSLYTSMAKGYDAILQKPLPTQFAKVRDQLKSEPDPVKKINMVLSKVAESIRYMGDWRATQGWLPRSMEQVAETQSGDCKDMALLTVKILRELEIPAWVALVERGVHAERVLPDVPDLDFNHAIVLVRLGDRKLWLDPTSFASFAEGINVDVANQEALILNPSDIAKIHIDWGSPQASQSLRTYQIHLENESLLSIGAKFYESGNMAVPLTGFLMHKSKKQLEEAIINELGNKSDFKSYSVQAPELKSRIVEPIQIKVDYVKHSYPAKSSVGDAMTFHAPYPVWEIEKLDHLSRESDYNLGAPRVVVTSYVYDNIKALGKKLETCEVKSQWLDYKFTISLSDPQADQRMEIKKPYITSEEVRSAEFEKFQNELKNCAESKYLVYTLKKKVAKK